MKPKCSYLKKHVLPALGSSLSTQVAHKFYRLSTFILVGSLTDDAMQPCIMFVCSAKYNGWILRGVSCEKHSVNMLLLTKEMSRSLYKFICSHGVLNSAKSLNGTTYSSIVMVVVYRVLLLSCGIVAHPSTQVLKACVRSIIQRCLMLLSPSIKRNLNQVEGIVLELHIVMRS